MKKVKDMKKRLVAIVLNLLLSMASYAQIDISKIEENKLIPPSPTAATLGKYGEYPVSLYSGLIKIEQPLLQIKSGRLSLDVSLSYHAGGNRPADIPGWVGLGFSLNAGGVITRTVRDLPDDEQGGFLNSSTAIKSLLTNYVPGEVYLLNYMQRNLDAKTDTYFFNFAGKTGEFFFDWDGNIKFTQVAPFKVQVNKSITGIGITSFVITTEDGLIYTFGQREESCYSSRDNIATWFASSWYLTKIENQSGDKITLAYTVNTNQNRYKVYPFEKYARGALDGVNNIEETVRSTRSNADKVIYLDRIDFNNGKILFSKSRRNDPYYLPMGVQSIYAEEKKLDAILLKDSSDNTIEKWEFQYIENNTERLKLQSLTQKDRSNQTGQQYLYSYNPTKLPFKAPPSATENIDPYATNSIDYWGYYNDAPNLLGRIPYTKSIYGQQYGEADRSPNADKMKAEILTQITHPTGGYTKFEYEANDYSLQGVSLGENPMEEYSWEMYSFSYLEGEFDYDPSTISFTVTEPSMIVIQRYVTRTGPNSAWMPVSLGNSQVQNYILQPGTYTLSTLFNTALLLDPSSNEIHSASASVNVRRATPVIKKTGPGLRMRAVTNFDGVSTNTKTYEYKPLDNSPASSGVLSSIPAYYIPLEQIWLNVYGFLLTSEPLNSIPEGPPVGYSRVTERFPDNSSIVHEYNTYMDYEDDFSEFHNGISNPLLSPLISKNYMRGLERTVSVFDAAGKIRKKVINQYEALADVSSDIPVLDVKTTVNFDFSDGSNPYIGLLTSHYFKPSRFVYLKSTEEHTYDDTQPTPKDIFSIRKTYYDNKLHLQPTRIETTRSDGSIETTLNNYADDYPAGVAFIDYMKQKHLVAYPIEQVRYNNVNNATTVLSGFIAKYKSSGNGLIDQVLKLEKTGSIPLASFKFSNRSVGVLPPASTSSSFAPDSRYQPGVTYNSYDVKGNVIEQQKTNDVKQSFIWDYNNAYPIAEAINAPVADIAYTSFEADSKGNWNNFTGTVTTVSAAPFPPTGKKYYNLTASATLSKAVTNGKEYIISYWRNNTSPFTINGGTSVNTAGQTINGWTYHRHRVTASSTTLTITGTGGIDEVRFYPSTARMTTYTYDPLIGMTSQCDASNLITYYEYDGFGRLRIVRDQDKNIIKRLCYNYAGQQEECSMAPLWQATGTTRCQVCAANNAYTTNIRERQEKDNNPASTTYNQLRWVSDGVNAACTITPDWKNTSTAIRCRVVNGVNTGEQEQEQKDANPCSPTYNQLRWTVTGTNTTACPLPVSFSLKFTNTTNIPYTLKLIHSGGTVYNFSVYPSSTPATLGTILQGTYTLELKPMSSSSTVQVTFVLNGTTQNAINFNQSNVALNASSVLSLQTYQDPGPCVFSGAGGFSVTSSSLQKNQSNATGYLAWYNTAVMNPGTSYTIASFPCCRPVANRTVTLTVNSRTWTIIFSTQGTVSVSFSGAVLPANTNTVFNSFSFPL